MNILTHFVFDFEIENQDIEDSLIINLSYKN